MLEKKVSPILEKGFYNHSQEFTCIQLKQYIITKKDDKRILLLRFFNESDLLIDGIELVLTQLSVEGEVIDNSALTITDVEIYPGETYTPDGGFVISDDCADFIVKVKSVSSDEYFYTAVGGAFVPRYNPKATVKKKSKKKVRNFVKKRNLISAKLGTAVALFLVIGFMVFSIVFSISYYNGLNAV